MKVSLVVASGVHQGKVIPIPGAEFLIGRDPECQLRPASPAISKKHCAFLVKDEQVLLVDLGSTNGTFVNDEALSGERLISPGDRVKVGPLDFTVQFSGVGPSDSTPLPDALKSVAPKSASGTQQKAPPPPAPKPASAEASSDQAGDDAAAMLLGMGDDEASPSDVPGGSTIMDISAVDLEKAGQAKDDKKKPVSQAESSAAAADLLRKYMRRPR